jgi:hypothetical protein
MQSIELMRKAVHKLPLANFNVLRRIVEHLSVASTHEDVTRMAEKQFSLVFGQTIFTPPESEGVKAIGAGMQYGNRVVEVLLIHVSRLNDLAIFFIVLIFGNSIMLFLKEMLM